MPPDWGRGWVMWRYELWCCLLQKPDSVSYFVCETAVRPAEYNELTGQLTSGTYICEIACMLSENILSKFYYDVNNWLKFKREWNFNMVISAHDICVIFKYLLFSKYVKNFYPVSVGNFIVFLAVKEFWKSIKIWESYSRNWTATFFLRQSVQLNTMGLLYNTRHS